jgi:hypothetical protein
MAMFEGPDKNRNITIAVVVVVVIAVIIWYLYAKGYLSGIIWGRDIHPRILMGGRLTLGIRIKRTPEEVREQTRRRVAAWRQRHKVRV